MPRDPVRRWTRWRGALATGVRLVLSVPPYPSCFARRPPERVQGQASVLLFAAKGNTLLNYCGVKSDEISFVAESSPYKQGKFLPGSHIPIVAEDVIRREKPDYVIILPWNLKNEISEKLSYIRAWDGKFVLAIPDLTVY